MPTPNHVLADHLLGGEGQLAELVDQRRAEGVSWRRIARELEERTGVVVTHETIRSWFPEQVAS